MKNFIATFFAATVLTGFAYAQDSNTNSHQINIAVPAVSLVDVEGSDGNTIDLEFTAPTEAGEWLTAPAANSDLWLNLSSTAKGSSTGKSVQAKVTGLPSSFELTVVAAGATSDKKGQVGTPSAVVTLSGTDQNVITGVKTGYTGDGAGKGFQLTYNVSIIDETAAIEAVNNDNLAVTVVYTMTGE